MPIVTVDDDLCSATGQCAGRFPDLFTQSGDDPAEVKDATGGTHSLEDLRLAVRTCPSGAIELDVS